MRSFGDLYENLEGTTSTNRKIAVMRDYFLASDPADAAWAVYFLSGQRIKRLIGGAKLREWLIDSCGLPDWLVEESYAAVGDLAETISLLVPSEQATLTQMPLADWLTERLLVLRNKDPDEQRHEVTRWWRTLDRRSCFLVTKMLTGALRVGVSKTLVVRALAESAGVDRAVIAHRLAGHWTPSAEFFQGLVSADSGEQDGSKPYPFYLASSLDREPQSLGPISEWLVEWKWDGIRGQIIRRDGETYIWSRGEDLVTAQFPEVAEAAAQLPDGTVIDGELIVWIEGVRPFSELQKRLGRKRLTQKLLDQAPVACLSYDCLEWQGEDIRRRPMVERRARLQQVLLQLPSAFKLSERVIANDWSALGEHREQSRAQGVEGVMLKRLDSIYGTGREKGAWWKWKIDPYTVDAVLIYAQAGHGRRAALFTDYTFAVWDDDRLVPIAKAYSGLSNDEIERLDRWIRRNTLERFGPVRSVAPTYVFELAFEGIGLSSRHKSGIALRFPRISRWRTDLAIADADSLEQVKRLIPGAPAGNG